MARRAERRKQEKEEELPAEFKRLNAHSPPKDGKIPLDLLFKGIYETVASSEAKKVSPEHLQQLKAHLDGV